MHSANDCTLRYLLKITNPLITPVGLNPISYEFGSKVRNYDVSEIIGGHGEYRSKLGTVIKLMEIEDEL